MKYSNYQKDQMMLRAFKAYITSLKDEPVPVIKEAIIACLNQVQSSHDQDAKRTMQLWLLMRFIDALDHQAVIEAVGFSKEWLEGK